MEPTSTEIFRHGEWDIFVCTDISNKLKCSLCRFLCVYYDSTNQRMGSSVVMSVRVITHQNEYVLY